VDRTLAPAAPQRLPELPRPWRGAFGPSPPRCAADRLEAAVCESSNWVSLTKSFGRRGVGRCLGGRSSGSVGRVDPSPRPRRGLCHPFF